MFSSFKSAVAGPSDKPLCVIDQGRLSENPKLGLKEPSTPLPLPPPLAFSPLYLRRRFSSLRFVVRTVRRAVTPKLRRRSALTLTANDAFGLYEVIVRAQRCHRRVSVFFFFFLVQESGGSCASLVECRIPFASASVPSSALEQQPVKSRSGDSSFSPLCPPI